jgi:hypothetical protein
MAGLFHAPGGRMVGMDLLLHFLLDALQAIAYDDGSFSVRRLLLFLLLASIAVATVAYSCGFI